MEKRLNLDIAGAISDFEELIKEFMIRKVIYKIIFRGKGLDFDGYRDFNPEDDASLIDWKASSRANKILVKQYIEERDLKILFVFDMSDNMLFGSTDKLKCEYAAEASAALAYLILNSGDKIGFALFNDGVTKLALPGKVKDSFNLFVEEISNASAYTSVADLDKVLRFLGDNIPESINAVILVSDFLNIKKDFQKNLRDFADRFETMAIMIRDPRDKIMPDLGVEVTIEDPETKEQMIVDPSIAGRVYQKNALEQEKFVKKIFNDADVDFVELDTGQVFTFPLAEFLRERVEKRKYIVPGR